MYRIHLSEEQRQELHQRAHTPGVAPRTRDRLEMVRLSDAGFSIPRIAGHLRISQVCVRSWIKRFLTGGFCALPDQPHLGQPSALTSEILQAVAQQLATEQQTWTAGQIADWVAERYGIQRSTKQMSRMLTRAKLSYKRTHRSLKHKQNKEEVAQKQRELSLLEKGGRGSAGSVPPR